MKEALKNDRARIQVGRISSFGLMEMSRQRLRTGVLEASTKPCPHCDGTGLMRTAASAGLSALRIIEDEAARGRGERILLRAGKEAAVYVLNKKRSRIGGYRAALRRLDRNRDRRELRRRPDDSRKLGSEADRGAAGRSGSDEKSKRKKKTRSKSRSRTRRKKKKPKTNAKSGKAPGDREGSADGERHGRRRRRRRRGGRGRGRREELETSWQDLADQPQTEEQPS